MRLMLSGASVVRFHSMSAMCREVIPRFKEVMGMALLLQPKTWTAVYLRSCRLQQFLCWISTHAVELTYTAVGGSPSWTVCCVREGWKAE